MLNKFLETDERCSKSFKKELQIKDESDLQITEEVMKDEIESCFKESLINSTNANVERFSVEINIVTSTGAFRDSE